MVAVSDESRERLRNAREKWMGDAERAMRTPFRERDAFDAGYRAAERDTLERCAQIAEEMALKSAKDSTYEHICKTVAERIRGKGAQ